MTGTCIATVLLLSVSATGPAEPVPGHSSVITTTTGDYGADRGVVALNAGRRAGVDLGDIVWVFGAGPEPTILAIGTVHFVTDEQSAGRLRDPAGQVTPGLPAAILTARGLQRLRLEMPPGATISGTISRLPPGRRTAWLSLGRRAALRSGDHVLVYRLTHQEQIPIARGRLELVEDDFALAALRALVSNAWPEAGDLVSLWPAPAEQWWGRLDSVVLSVEPGDEGPVVRIVGTADDGLAVGRPVELYRGDRFVGMAVITTVADPLSVAQVTESASREAPLVADRAVVRAGPGRPDAPLAAPIFRVEPSQQYCLFEAGESDGVQIGEKFVVRRPDPAGPTLWNEVADLTVTTVKLNHAGAEIRQLRPDLPPVARWDMARRRTDQAPHWRPVGRVRAVASRWRCVVIDTGPRVGLACGALLRLVATETGAAIVIHRSGDRLIAYVPPGWADLDRLPGARVDKGDFLPVSVPSAGPADAAGSSPETP